jgi:hypothetical protein
MSANTWVRKTHRSVSIAFTVTVVICFVALTGILPFWVFYVPLLPLFLLMVTGLYMFVLPYAVKRQGALHS